VAMDIDHRVILAGAKNINHRGHEGSRRKNLKTQRTPRTAAKGAEKIFRSTREGHDFSRADRSCFRSALAAEVSFGTAPFTRIPVFRVQQDRYGKTNRGRAYNNQ